ncbi:MAG: serine hydrolase [Pyrinomonadaceae bacterium]
MRTLFPGVLCALILISFATLTPAQKVRHTKEDVTTIFGHRAPDNSLQILLNSAVSETIKEFESKGLKPDGVAVTAMKLSGLDKPIIASYRGSEKIYPASVVKMFYMVALHRQLEDGKIKMTPELNRGLSDMITVSSNEATQYVLDVLTDTSSGAEKPPKEFEKWAYKRNAVNRYFASLGYTNINVNQKTFCEDAYGVEKQFRGPNGVNRNMLTTDATAKLLYQIAMHNTVTKERSIQMLELMKRDWEKPSNNPDGKEFISDALEPGTKLWSKEGWTSKTRHDAAYIETPKGEHFIFVIFTENVAAVRGIIPGIAKKILDRRGEI